MDPLAHTLLGAALAETGLKRLAPRAAAALVIGANIPDIDAAAVLLGSDASLLLRRGWTHGPLGLLLLPGLLVAGILALDRGRWRQAADRAGPPHAARLLGLAWLGALTHPALDWLNSYGVRLLMPFDGRWFYGDALFIVDPWMWLLPGAGAFLGHSSAPRSRVGWALLAALCTLLVAASPAPRSAAVLWLAGLAALVALRIARPGPALAGPAAKVGIGALVVYASAMVVGSHLAERQARAWLSERGARVERAVVLPIPGRSLAREVVVVTPARQHFVSVDWTRPGLLESLPSRERREPDATVQAALGAGALAGFRNWLRLPDWEVRPEGDGVRVILRDLRYARDDEASFGVASVLLDAAGRPRP